MKLITVVVLLWSILHHALNCTTPSGETPCYSCCQHGTPGVPGIPAVPAPQGPMGPKGELGTPGEVGLKGDKGDKGSVGTPGAPGETGEQVVGQPGQQGPAGLSGSKGEKGDPGPTGPMGQQGESAANASQVAFTVARITRYSASGGRLIFDETVFDEGANFDLSAGTFTCAVPGIYAFMFSVLKTHDSNSIYVSLYKNTERTVTVHDNTLGYHQLSSSSVMSLVPDDQVYLLLNGAVHGTTANFTSFTGFLLYAN
ncbi:collagen alpha-1(X) chain-like [Patiria miniata]|uniref:C1q domain-containing protein n=1 Tax=Patiria miniata TaxID=46514 RepID=A0A914B7N3_PATMI|nr:collagen alpha-1(X) chain-like [Patiria miniata]